MEELQVRGDFWVFVITTENTCIFSLVNFSYQLGSDF